MVAVPQGAADLFVDVLHPAGCRCVILTGGVGRETPPLWRELAERGLAGLFCGEADAAWAAGTLPAQVVLHTQGGRVKPVLDRVDLAMPPEELRRYCSEADVFLEVFCARCAERGLPLHFGGNPMAGELHPPAEGTDPQAVHARPAVFIETASTHTGTNVEYARGTLALVGAPSQ